MMPKSTPVVAKKKEPDFRERLEAIAQGAPGAFPGAYPKRDRLQARVLAMGLCAINETIENALKK